MNTIGKSKSRKDYRGRGAVWGFTVIEVLIALFLAVLVTSAAMSLYLTQQKQLIVQDEVSDMQASIRAATMELTEKIRLAGYKLPENFPAIVAHNTNPDTIEIGYNSDDLGDVRIVWPMPQPSSELRCDGYDLTGLYDGDWVYIFDPNTRTGEFFLVTQVQHSPSHIQHNTMPLSKCYPVGSWLMKLSTSKYYIDRSDTTHPTLMVQYLGQAPQAFADNITSIDFQYLLSNGTVVDVPPLPTMIREVLISVDARNNKRDSDFPTPYRNRALATRVKVRNLAVN